MPRIRGVGLGSGMAIGTAAVIREKNGIPIPPSIPNRIAMQIATHRLAETPEVVLIARDFTTALALSSTITWARVAAIAAETTPSNAPVLPIPVVIGLPGLVDMVRDDVLVLVDAGSNFVFPDPDPIYLAQYTAEHDRVAPKRRINLDEAHYPAQTIDGQTVQVLALIDDPADQVRVAMEQGADALFLPYNSTLHQAGENAQRKQMFAMIQEASGKPVILADPYMLPAMLLCEASAEADITVAAPYNEEPGSPGLPERRSELEQVENSCFDNDVPASVPRMATLVVSLSHTDVEITAVEARIEEIAASGATRVVFSLDHDSLSEGVLVELENYLSACARNLLPTYVSAHNYAFNLFGQNDLENTVETAVQLLVGARVTGIVVNPDQVEAAKRCICELDAEECRQRYWSVLKAERRE
jgi:phosphotransferase system enzyme I (PtsI)